MGKKRKGPKPDADGILRTGIYERQAVPKKLSPAEAMTELRRVGHEHVRRPKTLEAWIDLHAQCFASIIRPHLVEEGGKVHSLDLGEGWKRYQLADDLSSIEQETVQDAIDGINTIRALRSHFAQADALSGDLMWLVDYVYKLGHITTRIPIRQFEPLVRSRVASDTALESVNRKKPSTKQLKREAEKSIESAKARNPERSGDTDFIKNIAAKLLGIGKRALNARLRK